MQAYRIAEHAAVRLPIMICQDGFITSAAVENIELLADRDVQGFVGEYHPESYLLNSKQPLAIGPYAVSAYCMEAKRAQLEALKNAKQVTLDVAKEFAALSGREYGLFEEYKLADADYAMVIIGSAAGTAKDAVDQLRAAGQKVGLLKIRLFRPFPGEEIAAALQKSKVIACMDRTESFNGRCGPLGAEVKSALFDAQLMPPVINYVYGLGGRDVTVEDFITVFAQLAEIEQTNDGGKKYRYLSLRE